MSKVIESSKQTVLFSGRFNVPHPGHWLSILRLLKTFKRVVVVVLDYEGRMYPACYSQQVFGEMVDLSGLGDRVDIEINTTHFGEIDQEELDSFGCHAYAAGNIDVLHHVSSMMPCVYIDRAYDYAASNYKRSS